MTILSEDRSELERLAITPPSAAGLAHALRIRRNLASDTLASDELRDLADRVVARMRTWQTIENRGRQVAVDVDPADDDHVPFASVVVMSAGEKTVDAFTPDELRELADAMETMQNAAIDADEAVR